MVRGAPDTAWPATGPHFGGADGPATKETSRQEKTVLTASCEASTESSSLESSLGTGPPAQKGYVHNVSQGQGDEGSVDGGHRASSQQE